MNRTITAKPYSFEEFCFLVKDGQKGDLINGVIYVASPDKLDANELLVWLTCLIGNFVEARELGKIFTSRAAFRIDDEGSPEPDLAFVRKERLHLRRRGFFDGAPDLALEIVSPDSIDRDYKKKRKQYRQAGVAEYWILLRRSANGRYREVRTKKGVLASKVITGFQLRPEWLWQDPRPQALAMVQQLLTGVQGSDKTNGDSSLRETP
jgi:Uma2 family endonuclease